MNAIKLIEIENATGVGQRVKAEPFTLIYKSSNGSEYAITVKAVMCWGFNLTFCGKRREVNPDEPAVRDGDTVQDARGHQYVVRVQNNRFRDGFAGKLDPVESDEAMRIIQSGAVVEMAIEDVKVGQRFFNSTASGRPIWMEKANEFGDRGSNWCYCRGVECGKLYRYFHNTKTMAEMPKPTDMVKLVVKVYDADFGTKEHSMVTTRQAAEDVIREHRELPREDPVRHEFFIRELAASAEAGEA